MKITRIVPNFLKPVLRSLRYYIFKTTSRQKDMNEIHLYWKKPYDGDNKPKDYLREDANLRSQFLVDLVKNYNNTNANILEVGCNVGRNLNFLYKSGFSNLEAIEISEQAVQLLRKTFPKMAQQVTIYNVPAEDIIKQLKSSHYDVVFTMAVLEHVHSHSEWIFAEMVRITKHFLITIEDEKGISWRHFPRNYKKVFESISMKQIEEITNMDEYGLTNSFVARIFKKAY